MKRFSIATMAMLLFVGLTNIYAQKAPTELNLDPSVRYGKLPNGMTYYIRANELPKDRADFYIVFNVGAILENDNQDGLAHLTEHMAFNGTKNFPKKGILDFLEKNGVAFGHNVNAFTGQDVTAYNLNDVPITNKAIVDTSLMILRDWSNYIAFDSDEIDAERKVVHEEWRTRRSAAFRMNKKITPITLKGSKYAKRDVIGSLDVIDNSSYETLRSFYRDWYRPDLEALIIVGDFNAVDIEKKVIKMFSKVPKAVNPRERKMFEVPNNVKPLIGIASDPEAQRNTIRVSYKHNIVNAEDKGIDYLKQLLERRLYNTMINSRLGELVQKENPPFIVGYTSYGGMVRSKDAYTSIAYAKDNEVPKALTAILQENERVKQHGFTEGEFDRAKKNILRSYEKAYKEKDTQKNNRYVWEYFSHFLTNEPSPGIEFEYDFAKNVLSNISLSELNKLPAKWVTKENIVVSVTGIEKEGVSLPTETEILTIIKNVQNTELEPYIDAAISKSFVTKIPKASKIVDTKIDEKLGTETWTFSNGATVVIKKTDFKEDEILMQAYSNGGSSLVETSMLSSADMASSIIFQSGVGSFDRIAMQKMLSGKVVNIGPFLSTLTEGFNGSTSPEDLEIFMQILYLYFDNPRFDEKAYTAYMSRIKPLLQNTASDPRQVVNDSISFLMADRNMRRSPMNLDRLNKVSFDDVKTIYQNRFADISGFKFFFVGNIDTKKLKPLVETYIGAIEGKTQKETWKDNKVRPPKNNAKNEFRMAMETPKATVFVNYNKEVKYTAENVVYLNALKYILSMRYTETIREEQGGTYGVRVSANSKKYPYQAYQLNIKFDCDPERADQLKAIVFDEVEKLYVEGPSEKNVKKTIEYFIKTHEENLKENRFWLSAIVSKDKNNIDVVGTNYEEIVKAMTPKKLQKFSKKIFKGSKNVEVTMLPEVK